MNMSRKRNSKWTWGVITHPPILVLRSMHWEMCGNCRIFLHFLLLPLLLSAKHLKREPKQNQCGQRDLKKKKNRGWLIVSVTFSCLEVDRVGHDVLQFHEFQFDCGAGAGAGLEPRPIHTRSDTRCRPVRVRTPTDPLELTRSTSSACFQDGGALAVRTSFSIRPRPDRRPQLALHHSSRASPDYPDSRSHPHTASSNALGIYD